MLVVFRFVRFTDGYDPVDGTSGHWRIAMDADPLCCYIVVCVCIPTTSSTSSTSSGRCVVFCVVVYVE